MKTSKSLKAIFACMLFSMFIVACTPNKINDEQIPQNTTIDDGEISDDDI